MITVLIKWYRNCYATCSCVLLSF